MANQPIEKYICDGCQKAYKHQPARIEMREVTLRHDVGAQRAGQAPPRQAAPDQTWKNLRFCSLGCWQAWVHDQRARNPRMD